MNRLAMSLSVMALCAGLIAPLHAEEGGDKASAPGVYRGYAQKLYHEQIRTARYVTVRDGNRMAIDIYRPARDGVAVDTPYPVIWALTPYRRGFMKDGKVELSGGLGGWDIRTLTDYGYVVAVADLRGKGASFGARRGMADHHDGEDGYDITQWLAKQPWSTGKIGMTGCSYVGGTQDNTLSYAPPNLTAVFPGANVFNRYDFVSRGGMLAQYHTRPDQPEYDLGKGTLPVDEDKDGAMLAAARKDHERNTPMPDTWKGIPFRDDWSPTMKSRFWEESSPSTHRELIERSGTAIYKWAGWQDEFSADQFVAKANYHNPMKVLMLRGEHCDLDGFDMLAEQHRFFDYWLKGIDNGIMKEAPIHYFTYNAAPGHEWHDAAVWPLPETTYRTYWLGSGVAQGKAMPGHTDLLAAKPSGAGESHFSVDYSVLTNDGSTPSWIPSQDGHGLSYETAAFAQDVEMTGHPVVRLWIASTASDADLFAYVEEIGPDGKAVVRSHGRLRASHRALGTAPYDTLGLPWHRSFRADAQPLQPGQPAELDFDLLPTSTILRKGMKLRLVIAGADSRQRMGPPAGKPPVISILAGGIHASSLTIPVIPARP